HLAQTGTASDGALSRPLNDRAVGHGVRERNAQFDDVGTRLHQGMHELRHGLNRGIARRYVGNQGSTTGQPGESGLQPLVRSTHGKSPVHYNCMPLHSATVCMSLSPRPDKLTRMILSLPSVGAIFTACAIACDDSSAGMIPS